MSDLHCETCGHIYCICQDRVDAKEGDMSNEYDAMVGDQMERHISDLEAELAEEKAKHDFCYCAYCGQEFPVAGDTSDVSEHIRTCVKHPMRDVEAKLAEAQGENKLLRELLLNGTESDVKAFRWNENQRRVM